MPSRTISLACLAIGCSLTIACFAQLHEPAKVAAASSPSPDSYTPSYTKAGDLVPPRQYREWIYLSSGLGMNYNAKASDMLMFDNVFVNPEAYRSFVSTGTWPDKTVMVLETRSSENKGSINKGGHFQSGGLMGLEIHIKDEAHFPGKWAFFDVENETKATLIPQNAPCYTCHAAHAAVDTTFVQFYPTLLPIATKSRTLSASYLKEIVVQEHK